MVSGVTAGALPPEQSPASPTTDRQTSLESLVSGSNDPSTSRASVFLLEDGFVVCSGPAPDAVVVDVKSSLFCRASALSRDFQASSSRRSAVLSPPASITIDRFRLAARLTPFPARAFFFVFQLSRHRSIDRGDRIDRGGSRSQHGKHFWSRNPFLGATFPHLFFFRGNSTGGRREAVQAVDLARAARGEREARERERERESERARGSERGERHHGGGDGG